VSMRDEIMQRISDEKHRICGHIPPLHEGGCGVCNLALFAECEIVDIFKKIDRHEAKSEIHDLKTDNTGVLDERPAPENFMPSLSEPLARHLLARWSITGHLLSNNDEITRDGFNAVVASVDAQTRVLQELVRAITALAEKRV